jgi:hypothetical protein
MFVAELYCRWRPWLGAVCWLPRASEFPASTAQLAFLCSSIDHLEYWYTHIEVHTEHFAATRRLTRVWCRVTIAQTDVTGHIALENVGKGVAHSSGIVICPSNPQIPLGLQALACRHVK